MNNESVSILINVLYNYIIYTYINNIHIYIYIYIHIYIYIYIYIYTYIYIYIYIYICMYIDNVIKVRHIYLSNVVLNETAITFNQE